LVCYRVSCYCLCISSSLGLATALCGWMPPEAVASLRKFYWIQSLWELEVIKMCPI